MPKEPYVHDKRDLRSRRKLASDDRQASVKPLCACEIIYKVKKDLQGKRDLRSRRKLASDDRQASVKCASRSPRCTRLCWSPASSSATSSCAHICHMSHHHTHMSHHHTHMSHHHTCFQQRHEFVRALVSERIASVFRV